MSSHFAGVVLARSLANNPCSAKPEAAVIFTMVFIYFLDSGVANYSSSYCYKTIKESVAY